MSILQAIEQKLDQLNANFEAIPDWIPISKDLAGQYGWQTVDGMRQWCIGHISPDRFEKRGKVWHLHKSVTPLVKNRVPMM